MIAATLFSGIGAPETAMPHWDWPWHAEIEKFPAAVMAQRHPRSVNLGDVTAHDFAARAAKIARHGNASACKASRTISHSSPIAASPPLTARATRHWATAWPCPSCAGCLAS